MFLRERRKQRHRFPLLQSILDQDVYEIITYLQQRNMISLQSSSQSLPVERYLTCLNTEAFSELCLGDQDQAIACLQEGLTLAKAQLQQFDEEEASQLPLNAQHQQLQLHEDDDFFSSRLLPLELRDVLGTWGTPSTRYQTQGGFLFYRNVFLIDNEEESDQSINETFENSEGMLRPTTNPAPSVAQPPSLNSHNGDNSNDNDHWDLPTIYALLAYNLGVIHHELGFSAHGNFADLGQARHWYQAGLLCLHIAARVQARSVGFLRTTPKRLVMALFSNLGHVAGYLDDGVSMDICWQGMGEMLCQINVVAPSSSTSGSTSTTTTFGVTANPSWMACEHDEEDGNIVAANGLSSFASELRFFHRSWSGANPNWNRKCAPAA